MSVFVPAPFLVFSPRCQALSFLDPFDAVICLTTRKLALLRPGKGVRLGPTQGEIRDILLRGGGDPWGPEK